jgi:hypothetical protein
MTTQDLVFRWARVKRKKERLGWLKTAALWTVGAPLLLVACLVESGVDYDGWGGERRGSYSPTHRFIGPS